MSSAQQRILDILQQPQLGCFATITSGGKPWVRYVFCVGSGDMTVRFASFKDSRKVAQLRSNPEVHLTCGVTTLTEMQPYLQIQGRAEFLTDTAERHGFWKESLNSYFNGPDDPNYGVVVITPYCIELCTPGSNEPEVWCKGTN